jgi:hypothetical protein
MLTKAGDEKTGVLSCCSGKEFPFFKKQNVAVAEKVPGRYAGHSAADDDQVVHKGSAISSLRNASALSLQLMHWPQGRIWSE